MLKNRRNVITISLLILTFILAGVAVFLAITLQNKNIAATETSAATKNCTQVKDDVYNSCFSSKCNGVKSGRCDQGCVNSAVASARQCETENSTGGSSSCSVHAGDVDSCDAAGCTYYHCSGECKPNGDNSPTCTASKCGTGLTCTTWAVQGTTFCSNYSTVGLGTVYKDGAYCCPLGEKFAKNSSGTYVCTGLLASAGGGGSGGSQGGSDPQVSKSIATCNAFSFTSSGGSTASQGQTVTKVPETGETLSFSSAGEVNGETNVVYEIWMRPTSADANNACSYYTFAGVEGQASTWKMPYSGTDVSKQATRADSPILKLPYEPFVTQKIQYESQCSTTKLDFSKGFAIGMLYETQDGPWCAARSVDGSGVIANGQVGTCTNACYIQVNPLAATVSPTVTVTVQATISATATVTTTATQAAGTATATVTSVVTTITSTSTVITTGTGGTLPNTGIQDYFAPILAGGFLIVGIIGYVIYRRRWEERVVN